MEPISERKIIFLISAVQFINILDFMMVMPLGPDFAEALNIPASEVGIVGGAYTASAGLSGFIGSFFLDKFDRKIALIVSLIGLGLGTALGGFAVNLPTLIIARVIAGAFGGPVASLSLAIIADLIPAERRGKALGTVMGAFSAASVLGVPFGLELAHYGDWHAPFFALAAICFITILFARWYLPSFSVHLKGDGPRISSRKTVKNLLTRKSVLLTYLLSMSVMTAAFLIIPNVATYIQINLKYPREHMGILYMAGGAVSFFVMRFAGRMIDQRGPIYASMLGTLFMVVILLAGFYHYIPGMPIMLIFILFMTGTALRNVSYQSFASKVPAPQERAGFMSIQSTVQHLSCSFGAFLSSHFLYIGKDNLLHGMQELSVAAIVLALLMPVLMYIASRSMRV